MISPYFWVYGGLWAAAAAEYVTKKDFKVLYYGCWVMLTLFLCLRYGQGVDYFSYMGIYERAPETLVGGGFYYYTEGSELGWTLLCHIFRMAGLSFPAFVAFIGLVSMLSLHLFVNRFCEFKCLSLLLAYPTLYLTYLFSGLRQGLAMCLFLGILLPLFVKKRYLAFLIGILLCCTFHFSLIVCAAVMIYASNRDLKAFGLLFVLCCIGGALLSLPFISRRLPSVLSAILPFSKVITYTRGVNVSYVAVAERVVMLALVLFLYNSCPREKRTAFTDQMLAIYITGISFYMLLMWNELASSRLTYAMKVLEIFLIPWLLIRVDRRWGRLAFLFVSVFTVFMTYKNLGSYMMSGKYISRDALHYPYVSVFNPEAIHTYLL